MTTNFVNSSDQLADIFTKSLQGPRIQFICNKLGALVHITYMLLLEGAC